MLENVRMDAVEKHALINALQDINDEVFLFGSRLDSTKKGGDIDLMIFSEKNSLTLSRKVAQKFFLECEEKIDVVVFNKHRLSEEEKSFIDSVKLLRIK